MDDIKRPIVISRTGPSLNPTASIPPKPPSLPKKPSLPPPPKPRGRGLKITIAIIILIILGLGGFIAARAFNLSSKIFVGENNSFYKTIGSVLSSQTGHTKLIGEDQGQINILLLGIGGEGHDGPYLSDTIIVAQIRPGDQKASMVSVPRDYLVNLGNNDYRKINAAFSEGYTKRNNWDDGGKLSRQVVGEMSGLNIPYFAVLDFQGFQKAIDLVGGVDVTIDRTFTDFTFPDNGIGYIPAVTFTAGEEHMDGRRALIFARSRHAAGSEGTDFARSQRQQKIINATKIKVTQLNLITDIGKINNLFSVIGNHVHTNLSPGKMLHLYDLTKGYDRSNIISNSLDPATGLVCNGTVEATGAFVVQPCPDKTKSDIINYFRNSFAQGTLTQENSIIWLADSTPAKSLYKSAETKLAKAGFTVLQFTYKGSPLSQNVAYAVNSKPAAMEFLKTNLKASAVTLPPPGVTINKDKVDIIVILGE